MLVRATQIKTLTQVVEDQFAKNIRSLLVEHFRNAGHKQPSVLIDFVQSQTIRARSYGMNTQHSAACYVITAWLLGGNFDETLDDIRSVLLSSEHCERKAYSLMQKSTQLLATREKETE